MNRLFSTRRVCMVLFFGAGLAGGCGGPPPVVTVPVSGKVTVDGQPATTGQVSFLNVEDKTGAGLCAGTIGANGEYQVFTDGKPGAPVGKYKVTVTPSMVPQAGGPPPAPPYNARYSNSQATPLTIEVKSSAAAGAYDLKLTK